MLKHIILLSLLGILSACNYHLRGSVEVPEVLRNLYLQSASPELHKGFEDTLKMDGAQLVAAPNPKGVIIHVINEKSDRRALSLSSAGKASEYELYYGLTFEVVGFGGQMIMPQQIVEVKRNYFNDQQDIIGKTNEEALIRQEMYRQAVNGVMDRGRALIK